MPRQGFSHKDRFQAKPRLYEPDVWRKCQRYRVSTKAARREAAHLVRELKLEAPVDVQKAARYTGARVVICADVPRDAAGRYLGNGIVEVASGLHPWTFRVTLAHELGHHVLEHDIRDRWEALEDPLGGSDPHEKEAWAFAAELLIPRRQLKAELEKGLTLSGLASAFEVTKPFLCLELDHRRLLGRLVPERRP